MNIGIVTTWFERGAAYVSRQYFDALCKENNMFIFARGGESYAIDDPTWNKPYVTWGKKFKDSSTRVDLFEFRDWIKKNSIDLVIFNEQQDWEVVVYCKRHQIKTAAYIDYYTQDTVKFFDLYDAVICNTKKHYSVFKNHRQSIYVPWGTNVELFKPRDELTLKESEEIVFFHSAGMGGIGLRKGTDLLVKAFDRVKRGAKLIIHSQVPLATYGEVASIINNNENIEFIEKTVSAPGLYHLGDVYVYPSRLEGLGLTVIEALASGLPVITTNCAPMNEFVIDGYTGFLVDVEFYLGRVDGYYWAESHCSVDSLIEKLQYFVDNKETLVQMRLTARKYAEENLNWKNNSACLSDILSNVKISDMEVEEFNKIAGLALLYSYKKRAVGDRFYKRISRKLYKYVHGLNC